MNHLHKEAWREAVRSGDLDRTHPVDCRCRECALEEVGE
jgi:hypothetical protein